MASAKPTGCGLRKPHADTAFARWAVVAGGREHVADLLDISLSYVNKLAQGQKMPSLMLAAKIELLSKDSGCEVNGNMMIADCQRISSKKAA